MKTSKSSIFTLCILMLATLALTAIPDFAHAAAAEGGIGDMMCGVVGWFNGKTGKGIATLAIIVLGIAAFFGKVTWGMALMFAIGIFAIFGAADIVDAVGSGGGKVGSC